MSVLTSTRHLLRHQALLALLGVAVLVLLSAPRANAVDVVPGSLSDVRITDARVNTTLVLRSSEPLQVNPAGLKVALGGQSAPVDVVTGEKQARSTMLVIDTSGSMGASGMATVRGAVKKFLDAVPKSVKVGMVSFADTAGVDVAPTTDYAKVSKEVGALTSKGETALYRAVQVAVKALGTEGERSIILLSDGGDTVAKADGGPAKERSERKAALDALAKAKVRAEAIAFKSAEGNGSVLAQFARAGGGSVANAGDSASVTRAFEAAARTLVSQAALTITIPQGVNGTQKIVVTGTASGKLFEVDSTINLGDTAPVVTPSISTAPLASSIPLAEQPRLTAIDPALLVPAVLVLALGLFFLTVAFMGPAFRSRRAVRVEAIEAYGLGRSVQQRQAPTPSAIGQQLVQMGDRVMEGRESTTKTMQLLDRADLPWRAGEWLVLRLLAVVIAAAIGFLLLGPLPVAGLVLGAVVGIFGPPFILRFLAKRRTKKFEAVLPDVLMLVATSLASGFSLLQSLDSVARDAPEPAAKEFSRALAEARIGADVSDALEHAAVRMESENMRWTVMAIRIQRDVGGNLAETLRTTAATLREREMLRRQVRALSAEGRLSAYILVALPILLFFYSMWANYDYVSLLWTTFFGIVMSIGGIIALIAGIFWMRQVVNIEV